MSKTIPIVSLTADQAAGMDDMSDFAQGIRCPNADCDTCEFPSCKCHTAASACSELLESDDGPKSRLGVVTALERMVIRHGQTAIVAAFVCLAYYVAKN